MKELRFSPTKYSPEIVLDPDGYIKIKGRSIHENVIEFFEPVESWISEYIKEPAEVTHVDINLEYFNSASARIFVHLLEKLTYVDRMQRRFIFNWYYENGDDDILERGEYFASVLNVPFTFIKIG